MAKAKGDRIIIHMTSPEAPGYRYTTQKNRRNDPERMVLSKYDPVIRRHVEFREER